MRFASTYRCGGSTGIAKGGFGSRSRTCFPFNPRAGIAVGHLLHVAPETGRGADNSAFRNFAQRKKTRNSKDMPAHLILGGARSGKSRHAESLAVASGLPVTVIATAEALDDEMKTRIRRHQDDRPSGWRTVETPVALAATLAREAAAGRCVIVDCLTLWLSNLMADAGNVAEPAVAALPPALHAERAALLETLPTLRGEVLLVANEVGLGLVPDTALGRVFRDEAGRLNQMVAAACERVTFVAAGLPLALKGGA